jgi:hypothetical protein
MFRARKLRREAAREAGRSERREARTRPKPKRLSEEIAALRDRFIAGPVTLGDVVLALQERAWMLVLIILSLPFIVPIGLPFLSIPFGLAIGFIALRLALGQQPWLPAKLLAKPLPPGFFDQMLNFSGRVLRFLEKFLRPRLSWLALHPWAIRTHAVLIISSALVLLLPLPVPFTNGFPAWVVLLVACGLLERDGLAIIAAYLVGASGLLFFYLLGEAALRLVDFLKDWIGTLW